ncbi:DNA binding protein [Streptomyces phage Haizum]|nr:DNA binding protein [Streptomyces phage Haizum]QAY15769.1 DNA binding protein [Streptomyces phage Nishikigoi]
MKLQVTTDVTACDICQQYPAKTYTISVSDGRSVTKDLCEEHAEPFEEWLEEAELGEGEAEQEPEPKVAAPKKAPAKRAPAKKATAKKTTAKVPARRRPKIVTLDEIEKMKQG